MSLLRTLDRTSAVSQHQAPFLSFLCPVFQQTNKSQRKFSSSAIKHVSPTKAPNGDPMEAMFIRALVRAGSCSKHTRRMHTPHNTIPPKPQEKPRRRILSEHSQQHARRGLKTKAERKGPLNRAGQFAKKELKAMVDYYGIELDTRPEDNDTIDDEGPLVWNVGDNHEPWPLREATDYFHIRRLKKLLKDDESPHEQVFDTYRKLPSPGVVYLDTDTIRRLLHHLSVVERPTPEAMQRFMSVLDDMKSAHIHINQSEWTTAIYFAGRCMGAVSGEELASALNLWRDMEHRAGVEGGFVTLNVLFDVAVKAGKYTLADTFLKELRARKLKLHRHFRVSLLYYYGVLRNGTAVRRTYQDLVEAGDIVDTAVMNAVIAALFRAGEPAAAEHVFERMKKLHAAKDLPAPGHRFFMNSWRDRRAVALHFTHTARSLKKAGNQEQLKELQDYAPIAPNSRTYALLIRHHSTVSGDIDRVNELLQEARSYSVPVEGTTFIVMFHGFGSFGGIRYSSWTADKLERLWAQFLQAIANEMERTWLSALVVIAALKAFKRCTDHDRTLRAWEEIRPSWQPNERELESVMQELRRIDVKPGFFSKNVRVKR
jgi:pentatricopeptide repeat protein